MVHTVEIQRHVADSCPPLYEGQIEAGPVPRDEHSRRQVAKGLVQLGEQGSLRPAKHLAKFGGGEGYSDDGCH